VKERPPKMLVRPERLAVFPLSPLSNSLRTDLNVLLTFWFLMDSARLPFFFSASSLLLNWEVLFFSALRIYSFLIYC